MGILCSLLTETGFHPKGEKPAADRGLGLPGEGLADGGSSCGPLHWEGGLNEFPRRILVL